MHQGMQGSASALFDTKYNLCTVSHIGLQQEEGAGWVVRWVHMHVVCMRAHSCIPTPILTACPQPDVVHCAMPFICTALHDVLL